MDQANYSAEEWEVLTSVANVWHQMSTANGLVPLWQVKATLRRRDLSPSMIRDLIQKGYASMRSALRMALPKVKSNPQAEGVMVEFALPDLHLGKLAWSDETGHGNWDLKIASEVFKDAIEDLVCRAPNAQEAWLVVGNDFYNVDNDTKTTTGGTPQDEDCRWQKTFVEGKQLVLHAIARLRKKYPMVRVIVVYGNHDRQRSFYLGECLAEGFIEEPSVVIDNRPLLRKYYQWGNTGIGYTHGDKIKTNNLAFLAQNEARDIWGKTTRFEIHLGHLHQEIVKTLGGIIIRWLPALCPPDAWHATNGYVMTEKAAMALVYDQKGMNNLIVHYPEPKQFS
jgi:predicted phosphodiesterase